MLCVTNLSKSKFFEFKKLNDKRSGFNSLNEDFFDIYNNSNLIQRIFLKGSIRLLEENGSVIGFLWIEKYNDNAYRIRSISVAKETNLLFYYKYLLDSKKRKHRFYYLCESNDYNFAILQELGFEKREGTYEMDCYLGREFNTILIDGVQFETLQKGKHENIRCRIQNAVFKNDNRVPLSVEDMYFDEIQDYYYGKGAVFIKHNDDYIGYGQIIIDNNIPTIVNIGILNEYRGRGFGKCLLLHLFNILRSDNFKEVKLKVNCNNSIALKLYEDIGFKLCKEYYTWELKNK